MTRGHEWRRTKVESPSSDGAQFGVICTLAPGETLLRTRGQVNLTLFYTQPDIMAGLPVCWGLVRDFHGLTAPSLNPNHSADINDPNWLWWEGISMRDSPVSVGSPTQYIAYGPQGDPRRDVKAKREAFGVDGSDIWFTGVTDPNVTVGTYAWQWTFSCLVLLAP